MMPFTDVRTALAAIETYSGPANRLVLPIDNSLLDPLGVNMALITDRILAKGWEPDGFEQRNGFRLFRYKDAE
jgi:hypothetical protein